MRTPILNNIFARVKELKNVDKACAEYTIEVLDKINFKPLPDKPISVMEHERIPQEERRLFHSSYYKDHPSILPYYTLVTKVKLENKSTYDWLVKCMKVISDRPSLERIHEKITSVTSDLLWQPRRTHASLEPTAG